MPTPSPVADDVVQIDNFINYSTNQIQFKGKLSAIYLPLQLCKRSPLRNAQVQKNKVSVIPVCITPDPLPFSSPDTAETGLLS